MVDWRNAFNKRKFEEIGDSFCQEIPFLKDSFEWEANDSGDGLFSRGRIEKVLQNPKIIQDQIQGLGEA